MNISPLFQLCALHGNFLISKIKNLIIYFHIPNELATINSMTQSEEYPVKQINVTVTYYVKKKIERISCLITSKDQLH